MSCRLLGIQDEHRLHLQHYRFACFFKPIGNLIWVLLLWVPRLGVPVNAPTYMFSKAKVGQPPRSGLVSHLAFPASLVLRKPATTRNSVAPLWKNNQEKDLASAASRRSCPNPKSAGQIAELPRAVIVVASSAVESTYSSPEAPINPRA